MIFLYITLIKSIVIEYNSSIVINESITPLAVYCYRSYSRKDHKKTFKQINLCSKIIPDIYFLCINCTESENNGACEKYCPSEYNFAMIRPNYHIFDGESIAFDLVNFFEKTTGKKRINITTTYQELFPETFSNYIRSMSSSLVAFLEISDKMSDLMIPQLQQIAFIFSGKPKIGVAFIDCKKYIDFCLSQDVEYVPSLRAYHGNNYTDYLGPRTFDDLLNFSNSALNEYRSNDGCLSKRAGIIPSLYPLVQRFMKDNDKFEVIEEVKKVGGSEYYVVLMKRILKNGDEALEKEEKKIRNALQKSTEKLATNDILRSSLNILKEFKRAGPYTPLIHTDSEL